MYEILAYVERVGRENEKLGNMYIVDLNLLDIGGGGAAPSEYCMTTIPFTTES